MTLPAATPDPVPPRPPFDPREKAKQLARRNIPLPIANMAATLLTGKEGLIRAIVAGKDPKGECAEALAQLLLVLAEETRDALDRVKPILPLGNMMELEADLLGKLGAQPAVGEKRLVSLN